MPSHLLPPGNDVCSVVQLPDFSGLVIATIMFRFVFEVPRRWLVRFVPIWGDYVIFLPSLRSSHSAADADLKVQFCAADIVGGIIPRAPLGCPSLLVNILYVELRNRLERMVDFQILSGPTGVSIPACRRFTEFLAQNLTVFGTSKAYTSMWYSQWTSFSPPLGV